MFRVLRNFLIACSYGGYEFGNSALAHCNFFFLVRWTSPLSSPPVSKSTRHVTILQDVLCFTVVPPRCTGFPISPSAPGTKAASALKVRSMATPPPSDSAVPPPEGAAEAATEAAKAVAGSGSGGWLLNRKIV